jgi:hypothetical protein
MMELLLERTIFTDDSTIGQLSIMGGSWLCYILEDPVRDKKIPGKTAIPYGRYRVIVSLSPKFKQIMLELVGVKGFTGIRIHTGNKATDTEGCLIPGLIKLTDEVRNSWLAYSILAQAVLAAVNKQEEIYITIRKGNV